MTNPTTPAAEAAAEAYAREKFAYSFFPGNTPEEDAEMIAIWVKEFLDGWSACLQHLSEQGAEFDEAAFGDWYHLEGDRYAEPVEIARYQHAQSQAVIAGLRAQIEWLNKDKCQPCDQSAEIAALKADNAEYKRVYPEILASRDAIHAEIAALKSELANAAVTPPIATNTGWPHEKALHAEIERLRAELAEAREIVEAGCYIGSFDCDQQLGLQERCERFMRCGK